MDLSLWVGREIRLVVSNWWMKKLCNGYMYFNFSDVFRMFLYREKLFWSMQGMSKAEIEFNSFNLKFRRYYEWLLRFCDRGLFSNDVFESEVAIFNLRLILGVLRKVCYGRENSVVSDNVSLAIDEKMNVLMCETDLYKLSEFSRCMRGHYQVLNTSVRLGEFGNFFENKFKKSKYKRKKVLA